MEYVEPIGGAADDPYVDANPSSGIEGSPVPAAAIEHPLREIVEVIKHYLGAGAPDSGDLTQLRQAIETAVEEGAGTGRIDWFAATSPPTGWLKANGAALSRASYGDLLSAISFTDATVDTTNGSATVQMDNTGNVEAGYTIEGDGIPVGTTVTSVDDGTTLTLSQAATATASNITARFLPWGGGDGSTTFTIPDLRGEFPRGWDDARGVDSGRALGSWQADEFKSHKHDLTVRNATSSQFTGGGDIDSFKASETISTQNTGGAETRPRNVALLACIKY